MNLPNLLLAGAPRCGTTAVFDWLVTHPSVSGAVDKEIFYLMDSGEKMFRPDRCWQFGQEPGYAKLFPENNTWMVDGTTLSIYQQAALEYAARHSPHVLMMVRCPAERAYSTFRYYRDTRQALPQDLTFDEFIRRVRARSAYQTDSQLAQILDHGEYIRYLRSWRAALPAGYLQVQNFDVFMADPSQGMAAICEWLEIPDLYANFAFSVVNESRPVRSRWLFKAKESLASLVGNRQIKAVLRPIYYAVNSGRKKTERTREDQQVIDELKADFAVANHELASEFGIDITGWR